MVNLNDYAPFTGLLIFGNIENLVLASQGAVAHVDPIILGVLSLIAVVMAIIILGFQSMIEAMGIALFP